MRRVKTVGTWEITEMCEQSGELHERQALNRSSLVEVAVLRKRREDATHADYTQDRVDMATNEK